MPLTSSAGILALLDDPMPELKSYALRQLMASYDSAGCSVGAPAQIIDVFWAEVSDAVGAIEQLHEDESFKDRKLAALVASKVYYHLGSYDDALLYALGAEELFDVNERSEYVDTMIAKCIDTYTARRKLAQAAAYRTADGAPVDPEAAAAELEEVDPRQEGIVNRMFQRCFDDGEFKQALGIAVETHRLDMFRAAITKANDKDGMLSYAFRVVMQLINNRHYSQDLLRCLVDLYRGLEKPDFVQMCQCLIYLDDPASVATLLETLSQGSEGEALMAYQIAFDMYESATQQFLNDVVQAIKRTAPIPEAVEGSLTPKKEEENKKAKEEEPMEVDEKKGEKDPEKSEEKKAEEGEKKPKEEEVEKAKEKKQDDSKKQKDDKSLVVKKDQLSEEEAERQARIEKLSLILSGVKTIYLHLQFLMRNDKSDMHILKQTKDAVRVSVCHNATVIANGFMHCGTTHDSFLRDNLDWLSRATNWAKLSATASLGAIHRGHESESLALMQSYLPKDSANSSGYAEGGGLYALGLIHANHGGEITEYLLNQVKEGGNEQIRSGGCLGLGLAAMGTHRADVYEQLKANLYQDDAATGEAAGIAMGLVELGSKSAQAIEDMVAYAQETQHEKILRGLAVGIALVMYGRLEEADPLIESLCNDKDPILRRSGMYTLAMAYCGTGSNRAIRRLLHVAVSDVNNDVRRAAVTALGFLLFKAPDQCPGVVSLLSESYNFHVRYGAAMALGIACAGTGSKEALALIEPMTNDPVNMVRQGALIASALILVQHTEVTCPKVKDFRALYAKVISDKHEDVMAKFGAILAQGIIDAGGRNATVTLQSRTGHTNMMAVVGMQVFIQYWYWFPLSHFLSLAFTPSCLIGLNKDLDMPVINFRSNAKPSTYGYPAPMEEKKKEDREKVATAVLSITAKQQKKKRMEQKEKEKHEGEKMEVDEESKEEGKDKKDDKKDDKKPDDKEKKDGKEEKKESKEDKDKEEDKNADKDKDKKGEEDKEKKEKTEEPNFDTLSNPARVMKPQLKVVQVEASAAEKYRPIKDVGIGGIIMLQNKTGEPCEIVEPVAIKKAASGDSEDEPDPPEPFVYDENLD